MPDITLKIKTSGNFSLIGNDDGTYDLTIDEVPVSPNYLFGKPVEVTQTVPQQFIDHGKQRMKEKFLVLRRDGTVPLWPWMVLGGRDPLAIVAAEAYLAALLQEEQADQAYVDYIREMVDTLKSYPKGGDHDFGLDDPSIVQVMRDGRGGRVFIAAAWDADQLRREQEKDAQQ